MALNALVDSLLP